MNESMNEELFYVFGDGFNGLDRMVFWHCIDL